MSANPLAILATGLATSVGLTSQSSCSAIRAKLTNPTQTPFIDSGGEWIMGHGVPLEHPWSGRTKLRKMAVLAIGECLADISRKDWPRIAMVLCVAERDRPGRIEGLDNDLFDEISRELEGQFSEHSLVVPHGRVSASIALTHARRLIAENHTKFVLIAATDSLLTWPTMSAYEGAERLLTSVNSNGFMPGESAGALLIGLPRRGPGLVCTGLGFADEPATINSELPLRGEGMAQAIRSALSDAGCEMHDVDFRIGDLSGEQYYFKEAALAMARILRVRKEELSLWHQAECIGECGAASGVASIVVANAACMKGYAPGPSILCHSANDSGQRAAAVFQYRRPL